MSAAFPAEMNAREARDLYLAENGFSVETYEAAGSKVDVFGFQVYRPLTPDAKWAIRRHDLHHVATCFGTDLVGEAEISAWEVGRGLQGLGLYVRMIVSSAMFLGLFIAPRRTWRAWRAGKGGGCLFAVDDYDGLLRLSVGELRAQLGIPVEGLAEAPRKLHAKAPGRRSGLAPAPGVEGGRVAQPQGLSR